MTRDSVRVAGGGGQHCIRYEYDSSSCASHGRCLRRSQEPPPPSWRTLSRCSSAMGHCAELRTTRPTPRRPMHKTARMWAHKPVGHIRPRGRAQLATLQLRPAQSGISCTEERRARRHHLHLYKTISAQSLLCRHLPYPEPGWGRGGGAPRGGLGWSHHGGRRKRDLQRVPWGRPSDVRRSRLIGEQRPNQQALKRQLAQATHPR